MLILMITLLRIDKIMLKRDSIFYIYAFYL